MFESVNFKEFLRLLAPFSARAPRGVKLSAMFAAYDVDADGARRLLGFDDGVVRAGWLVACTAGLHSTHCSPTALCLNRAGCCWCT
jgi:hypothetical protein